MNQSTRSMRTALLVATLVICTTAHAQWGRNGGYRPTPGWVPPNAGATMPYPWGWQPQPMPTPMPPPVYRPPTIYLPAPMPIQPNAGATPMYPWGMNPPTVYFR